MGADIDWWIMDLGRAANPAQGWSFGLDLPFMFREAEDGAWIVYRRHGGEIVFRFDGTEAFHPGVVQNLSVEQKRFWAHELAFRKCDKLNQAKPDLAAIDLTP